MRVSSFTYRLLTTSRGTVVFCFGSDSRLYIIRC